jgi:hypothetical protein
MTTQTKRTPTPWVNSIANISGGDYGIASCHNPFNKTKFGITPELEAAEANAAHIVKCVNAHDDLVEAIKAIVDVIQFALIDGKEQWILFGADIGERVEALHAALAKAQVQS